MSAVSQKTEQNSDGIDISNMLNDVNKVLHQHLTGLLTPMLREKQSIRQVLLNMPMVKQLQDEHLKAHQTVYAIQAEAKALKIFYEGELSAKNSELIKVKQELVIALKKLADCKNVALEVKEIPQPSKSPPIKIENDTMRKNEKVTESNSIKIATIENINSFSAIGDDSDEDDDSEDESENEEDSEKEEEDEEVKNIAVVKTVLLAQEAGEYATIDTASEEDEENVEEEDDEEDDEEEEEEEEDDEEEEEEDDEEGDFEVEDVTIDGEEYVATNIKNGTIYKLDSDGEILEDAKGEFVKAGYYKNGVSFIL